MTYAATRTGTIEAAGQNAGSLGTTTTGEYRIKICAGARTLLHELGHVWDKHNLTDDQRQAYLELRGLDSWSHGDWDQAGG